MVVRTSQLHDESGQSCLPAPPPLSRAVQLLHGEGVYMLPVSPRYHQTSSKG